MRHWLALGALLAVAPARARDAATDRNGGVEIREEPTVSAYARDSIPAPVQDEPTPFVVVDDGKARRGPPPDEVQKPHGYPHWVARQLERSRGWLDPFVGPEIFPEISVADRPVPSWNRIDDRLFIDNEAAVRLYVLDLVFPSTFADGERPRAFSQMELDLRIPIFLDQGRHHILMPLVGAIIPMQGAPTRENSGARMRLAYGVSTGSFAAHAWGGFDVAPDPLTDGPRRNLARYGLALGATFGEHIQIQANGEMENPRGEGFTLNTAAGLYYWPRSLPTIQLGLAGLLSMIEDAEFEVSRIGGVFELSYNFL